MRPKGTVSEKLHVVRLHQSLNNDSFLFNVTDTAAALVAVRGAVVEPERLVSVKPEVQVGAAQPNHEPRAQKTYSEELRREPVPEK